MVLDAAAVRRIAALARLRVDDAEADRLAGELTRIVGYVEQLGALTPAEPEPAAPTPRRADVAVPTDPEPVLSAAEGRSGRFVAVPTVVGEPE